MTTRTTSLGLLLGALLSAAGCPSTTVEEPVYDLSHDELMSPETCRSCHAAHVEEWEASMHAYAARDPVFLAMNAKGQRETNGELGTFCVECHAPMAVRLGLTDDGLNLDDLDESVKGVTCYFCHTAHDAEGEFNNPLVLAGDDIMRGAIPSPIENTAHAMRFSVLHDRASTVSSRMCGTCHDVVNGHGTQVEATFAEWKDTVYSQPPPVGLTCSQCHMRGRDAPIVGFADAPVRRMHSHLFPGVDVALDDITPGQDMMREAVQRSLDTVLFSEVCVESLGGGTEITVTLENFAAGHSFPSGATQDRRAWVEVQARTAGNTVFTSGVIDDDTAVAEAAASDAHLWVLGSTGYAGDDEVHMFWEVERLESNLLEGAKGSSPLDPNYEDVHQTRSYFFAGLLPDEVDIAVHLRPIRKDVLDELVESGDLAPDVPDRMPTFTLRATQMTWRQSDDERCFPPRR